MYKLITSAVLAFALVVSGAAFAADESNSAPASARVVKNSYSQAMKSRQKSRDVFETMIAVDNDTYGVLTVTTGGYVYTIYPGQIYYIPYGTLSSAWQYVSIYGYLTNWHADVFDETYLHVLRDGRVVAEHMH
ncbi:MAG: hypothetical protein M3R00_02055 [Pseudomonadota bacterium]|nr:hypothetical protein [Pseudomonadota bacterium]